MKLDNAEIATLISALIEYTVVLGRSIKDGRDEDGVLEAARQRATALIGRLTDLPVQK